MEPELNRFEVARVVGIRALDLENGAHSCLTLEHTRLREDSMYIAARELYDGLLQVRVQRSNGVQVDPNVVGCCSALSILLDTKDGGNRTVTRRARRDPFFTSP